MRVAAERIGRLRPPLVPSFDRVREVLIGECQIVLVAYRESVLQPGARDVRRECLLNFCLTTVIASPTLPRQPGRRSLESSSQDFFSGRRQDSGQPVSRPRQLSRMPSIPKVSPTDWSACIRLAKFSRGCHPSRCRVSDEDTDDNGCRKKSLKTGGAVADDSSRSDFISMVV